MKNRGNTYFELLRDLASLTVESAKLLLDGGDIKKTSAKAAKVKAEILGKLAEEFLPPLEREDIASITFSLCRLIKKTGLISEYLAFCEKDEKAVLNVYYYIKIIYDAIVCMGEDIGGENMRKCISQMNSLSAKCAQTLVSSQKNAVTQGIKKPLAQIAFCEICGGCYDELDNFCELLETVIIKNN